MTYFLDFDRTLFDTDRALPYIFEKPACANLPKAPYVELVSELKALVEQGALSFSEGELTSFLFPDSIDFLRTHECIIVTAGPVIWQRMKVESAFPQSPTPVIYTEEVRKGIKVKESLVTAHPSCFVDDSQTQLDSVAIECPTVQVFEMRRDGQPGLGKYPVVCSLSELP